MIAAASTPPESLEQWRPRLLTASLAASMIAVAPGFVMVLARDLDFGLRAFYVADYALLASMALLPRRFHRVRTAGFLVAGYALAAVTLGHLGLGGVGRLLLLGLPLFGLLLGNRTLGTATLLLSFAVYGLFTVLAFLGRLPALPPLVSGEVWLAQGIFMLMVLLPLAVLLERTLAFQETALVRVRAAAERSAAEAEERQRLEREVVEATERERRAVGHELHDGLCQQLTAGLIAARMLERELSGRAAGEARHAGSLAEIVDVALGEARALARGLSPGPLPAGGLGAALRELARQIRETVEVDCELVGDGAPSLGGAEAMQLFRIAQEATQNAVKHAGATRLTLELSEDRDGVRMCVRDDGRGLPADAAPGLGMRSMRARALSLGGSLGIRPVEPTGTEVVCLLGWPPPPEGAP